MSGFNWLILCFCAINLVHTIKGVFYSTNIIWSASNVTYYRPSWSGNVSINYTQWVNDIPGQIWNVSGVVLPISTSGRPAAPQPYNGYPTGADTGLDKGHLMALSIGGPDISRNVAPQASQWQQSGGWAQMEKVVYNFAVYKYGWQNKIAHASEIAHVSKPNSCNVFFMVEPVKYNVSNGQPLFYHGSVSCGAELYTFTISPIPGNDTAVWIPRVPPTDSSHNDKHNAIKGWEIVMIIVAIIVFILGILFVAYKYTNKKSPKQQMLFQKIEDQDNEKTKLTTGIPASQSGTCN